MLCLFVGAIVPVAPAFGAFTYPFVRELSPSGSPFLDVGSVAVVGGGTYVADSSVGAVDVFDSVGVQLTAWDGSAVTNPPGTPAGSFGGGRVSVAANDGAGEVYVLDPEHNVVDVLGAAGEYVCQITGSLTPSPSECNGPVGSATPAGGFLKPGGVAVDQETGEVYVVDAQNGVIDVFDAAGAYLRQISLGSIPTGFNAEFTRGIAVSDFNHEVYVSDSGSLVVYVFSTAGEYLTTWNGSEETNPPGTPAGSFGGGFLSVAANNTTGFVYITETTHLVTDVVDAIGRYLTQFSHSYRSPLGTAVEQGGGKVNVSDNSPGAVDVLDDLAIPDVTTASPTELGSSSVTLNGVVNPDGLSLTDCHFDFGTTVSYGQVVPCVPGAGSILGDSSDHPVSASVAGLSPDTIYHYRLQASNANGTNVGQPPRDVVFTTPGPGIHEEFVTDVASTSATFGASIDPNNAPTSYYFQYSTSDTVGCTPGSCSSVPVAPGEAIGSGKGDVIVPVKHVQGLVAGTTYHYRVVAVSELVPGEAKEFFGSDQTFTTDIVGASSASSVLLDGRAWELVSPTEKHGALLLTDFQGEWAFQAAAAGNAMTYLATAPTEAQPQGFTNLMQVLSTRSPRGWRSQDIEIPHSEQTGQSVGEGEEYRFFSSDLSLGALQPFGTFNPSLSAEASEQTPYLRTNYPSGDVNDLCNGSCYRPLVTGKLGFANVPEGTVFGGLTGGECPEILCGPRFLAATPDLSHVVLSSEVALTGTAIKGGLYEWSAGGGLQLVSVLPASEEGGAAVAGLIGDPNLQQRTAKMVSDDGSRVVWTAGNGHLYVRDVVRGESVRLDSVQAGASGEGPSKPLFQAASGDGSRVFFTDEQRLTKDAGSAHLEPDLYECEMVVESGGELGCRLSDLTPSNASRSANVQSIMLGASDDGSWVYFVADGVQKGNPDAVEGAPNLYVYHAGITKLVAVLSPNDAPDWAQRSSEESARGKVFLLTGRVSSSGKWLVFMSQRSLTGYDNRDAVSGKFDEEVYLYDATSGRVVCTSCNPSGARPVGVESQNDIFSLALGEDSVWRPGTWVAGNVPGWTLPLYQSRYLSDSGRVFFNSNDALVSQDVNGTEDVYEFEPVGVGSCSVSSVTFSVGSGGCVGLVSSGRSAEESAFLDASDSGGDVFFLTSARLVSQDFDTSLDVYDAHECSSVSPCFPVPAESPPPCSTGDSCKPPPSPQPEIFGAPSSAMFSGAGNVAAPISKPKPMVKSKKCRRGFVKRHGKCAKRKKAKRSVRRAKRSAQGGRR